MICTSHQEDAVSAFALACQIDDVAVLKRLLASGRFDVKVRVAGVRGGSLPTLFLACATKEENNTVLRSTRRRPSSHTHGVSMIQLTRSVCVCVCMCPSRTSGGSGEIRVDGHGRRAAAPCV